MKILFVDDMPQILRSYKRMLNLEEHQVMTASDPVEARRLMADGFKPDVIFSDWEMPRMNGGEFCQVLRLSGDETPFYIISGQPRNHVEVGAGGSMQKPVSILELKAILNSHK